MTNLDALLKATNISMAYEQGIVSHSGVAKIMKTDANAEKVYVPRIKPRSMQVDHG